ncbi:uncharacterized protein LOC123500589 [Portunus trituberculatus]|uniref:uncharacterized protein LOC123500589 n=1 Tax=Portunus trituberculatus TaxID=210409 RepID=UPI001E1CBA38|nr:uncharacterized protein LOC123500589 [Portunus trituberculatus]
MRAVYAYVSRSDAILSSEAALEKIVQGGYTLICFNDYISVIVASYYTDDQGRTPYYISRKGFSVFANLGWAFRKGAPFYDRFNLLLNRLEDTGITSHWTKDVLRRRIKENRVMINKNKETRQAEILQKNSCLNYTHVIEDKKLPFPDVLVHREESLFSLTVYIKSTNLGFSLNGKCDYTEK